MALAHEAIGVVSGKRGARQGFQTDIVRRRAVEKRAMAEAIAHFAALGWQVTDVSARRPFDLSCTRNGETLHVEAKGTTTTGEKIVLTRGEVEHNGSCGHDCLYLLRDVVVSERDGQVSAAGGVPVIVQEWRVTDDRLEPIAYEYTV